MCFKAFKATSPSLQEYRQPQIRARLLSEGEDLRVHHIYSLYRQDVSRNSIWER